MDEVKQDAEIAATKEHAVKEVPNHPPARTTNQAFRTSSMFSGGFTSGFSTTRIHVTLNCSRIGA